MKNPMNSSMNSAMNPSPTALDHSDASPACAAWWHHPMLWLVISGPALVVIAGFWTLWLALSQPDPLVGEGGGGPKVDTAAAEMPAQIARNHAATSRVRP